jgi:hypothetical protein
MADMTVNTGPFKNLAFIGHDTADSFDKEAGKIGACVEEADASLAYRSTLPDFHDKFTPRLEELSGVKRGVNQEQTDKLKARAKDPSKVNDVPESFITFANRAKTSVSEDVWKKIDEEARALAKTIKCDASPAARERGPKKMFLDKADSWLTLDDNALEAKIGPALNAVPDFDLERDDNGKPERSSLARLIERYVDTMV